MAQAIPPLAVVKLPLLFSASHAGVSARTDRCGDCRLKRLSTHQADPVLCGRSLNQGLWELAAQWREVSSPQRRRAETAGDSLAGNTAESMLRA